MARAVVILADGFEEIEALTPVDLLRRAGVQVTVAALNGVQATGRSGVTVVCDLSLQDLPPGWDVLVLPGGMPGAANLAQSPLVQSLVKEAFAKQAWVAAICAAPARVLGSLGYLEGRRFTGYPGTESGAPGGLYSTEAVVTDGRIITSRGVGTASAFGLQLVQVLAGPEKAAEVARSALL